MSVFGDFGSSEDIEVAVLKALEKWLPTYLRRIESVRGLDVGELPEIRSFSIVSDYDRYPQEQLPAVTIESPGLVSGSLTKDGAGYYSGSYAVEVSVTTAADEGVAARQGAQRYGEAVRGALLQHRSLDTDMQVADWVDESLVGENEKRTRRVTCANAFEVDLHNLISIRKGPAEPDLDPDLDEATVQEIDVNTEVKE
jgi:hypothetical protein